MELLAVVVELAVGESGDVAALALARSPDLDGSLGVELPGQLGLLGDVLDGDVENVTRSDIVNSDDVYVVVGDPVQLDFDGSVVEATVAGGGEGDLCFVHKVIKQWSLLNVKLYFSRNLK